MPRLDRSFFRLSAFALSLGMVTMPACDADKSPAAGSAHVPKVSGAGPAEQTDTPANPAADVVPGEHPADEPHDDAADSAKSGNRPAKTAAPPQPTDVGATGRRLPPDDAATQGTGDPCDRSRRCGPGLACSGLFEGVAGTCIAVAEATSQCLAQSGQWGVWGLSRSAYCMKTYADGGQPCDDSGSCKGRCLQGTNDKAGKCEAHQMTFGCHAELKDGKPGPTICQD